MVISRIACDTTGYFTRGVGIHWYRDRYNPSCLRRRVDTTTKGRVLSFSSKAGNPAGRRALAGVVRLRVVEKRHSLRRSITGITEDDTIDYFYKNVGGGSGHR